MRRLLVTIVLALVFAALPILWPVVHLHAALSDSLTACWPLDEASGNRASAVGSYTLTDSADTVASTTGLVYALAADFVGDGVSTYEYLQSATGAGGGDDFTLDAASTIALWVYTDEFPGAFRVPIGKGTTTGTEWRVYQGSGGIAFRLDASSDQEVTATLPSTGAWHLYVLMYDPTAGANGTIYFQIDNGTLNSTALSGAPTTVTSSYLRIGTSNLTASLSQEHNGRIGPIAAWSQVLSSDDRTALYNGGSGVTCAAMAAASGPPDGSFGLLGVGR